MWLNGVAPSAVVGIIRHFIALIISLDATGITDNVRLIIAAAIAIAAVIAIAAAIAITAAIAIAAAVASVPLPSTLHKLVLQFIYNRYGGRYGSKCGSNYRILQYGSTNTNE